MRRQVLYHWVTKEAHSINIFYYIYDGGVGADLELHPVNKREVIRLLDREPHHHSSARGCIIRWPAQRPRSGERKSLQSPLNFSYSYVSFERVIQLLLLEREESTLRPHEPQHARLPCPSPNPWVHPNSCLLSQWCHPTISSSVVPFFSHLNLSQHQGLFKWVSSLHQVAKVLEFQLQHQSFQWTPRTDLL